MDCQNKNCKYYKKKEKAVPEEQKVGVEYDSERNK